MRPDPIFMARSARPTNCHSVGPKGKPGSICHVPKESGYPSPQINWSCWKQVQMPKSSSLLTKPFTKSNVVLAADLPYITLTIGKVLFPGMLLAKFVASPWFFSVNTELCPRIQNPK
ncbi:hypothetical protein VNO77_33925 [Canavalia gladiata]|uniref:Uncharacterized protein n=1 Tax=Canavalia gladiata TaxID=3824 RepID=A0AAN9PZD6_CANGL